MNRSIFKNTLRSIWKTKGRFLAIFAIIALGSGFFAGVKVTSPDMKLTADAYYKDTHLADLHLKSTVGFSRAEVQKLAQRQGIAGCYGGYSTDQYLHAEDTASAIARIWSVDFTQVGTGSPQEGRWPEQPDECLIEVRTPGEFKVGDTLTLDPAKAEEPVTDTLKTDTFTIVGVADWSMYVDFERGTTTVGNGKVESYILVPPGAFTLEVYTDVFLTLEDTRKLYAYDQVYTDTVQERIWMRVGKPMNPASRSWRISWLLPGRSWRMAERIWMRRSVSLQTSRRNWSRERRPWQPPRSSWMPRQAPSRPSRQHFSRRSRPCRMRCSFPRIC